MKNALILSSLVSALVVSAFVAALPGTPVSQSTPVVATVTTVTAPDATNDIPRITIVAKRLTAAEKALMQQQEQEQTAGRAGAEKQA